MKNTGKQFMRDTYYDHLSESPQKEGVPQPALELPIPEDAVIIPLPNIAAIEHHQMTLIDSILQRRSLRQYSQDPLTLEELSLLLFTSQGIQELREGSKNQVTFRTVPSAGARHAFETFVLINRVEEVPAGLYRYSALQHALVQVNTDADIAERVTEGCYGQKQVLNSAVTFVWAAVAERMTWRYVERGYRYLHLDAGHVCQNVSLVAEAINCGVCAIAAYDDETLNGVLGLDGEELFAIYAAALGKKAG
ncbi:MAG: SagB/ThcOx family dehydrogenase [Anaerolineae bacterium]|jgi:SagB-type dehydrogenase family enzyme|nr:SagB/ThcOx family dehydrogenase [Anaerolineae bacterium]